MEGRKTLLYLVVAAALLPAVLATVAIRDEGRMHRALAQARQADLVILNGKVITVDREFAIAEAVAVADGKIIAVGTRRAIEKMVGNNSRILDIQGETLLPGMNDTHLHFQWLATKQSSPVLNMGMGKTPKATREEDKQAIWNAMRELHARGITSITDPGLDADYVGIYRELDKEGKLSVRVNILWCFSQRTENDLQKIRDGLNAAGQYNGPDSEWLNVSGLKIGADNLPNNKSAWMREDYMTGGNARIFYPGKTDEERVQAMRDIILHAHKLGYQVGVHATGDQSIKSLVEAFAKAESEEPKGLRHYVIHGDFTPVDRDLMKLMAGYNVGVSVQPALAMVVGHSMAVNIRPEIMARFAPVRTLLDAGVHVAGGSDGPIIDPEWKQGMQSAITRRVVPGMKSGMLPPASDNVLGAHQSIGIREAIRMYTVEGAWLDRKEKSKGSVEVGKVADFCVLDEDILTVEPEKIKDIPVLMTIIGGKIVYNARPESLRLK